jgi:Putative auto-transporter adhesin, head GIN domain
MKNLLSQRCFGAVLQALCVALLLGVVAVEPARAETSWWQHLWGKGLSGSGRMVEEERQPGAFTAVRSDGAIDLTIVQGDSEKVRVRLDDNLIDQLLTVVEQGELVVRFKPGARVNTGKSPQVRVQVRELKAVSNHGSGDITFGPFKAGQLAVSLHGSGDLNALQLQADEVQITIAGSSDVRLGGQTNRLSISVSGSGDVHAEAMLAEHVKVSIRGSGDARVTANKSLAVSIAGSGDVRYGGQALAVTSNVAGSGSVRRR